MGSEQETPVVDSPATEAAPATETTTTATPEATTPEVTEATAPKEDSFTQTDPKSLPKELQSIYKSMQADYTRKTQAAAEVRKKADLYDQLSGDEAFIRYMTEKSNPQGAQNAKSEDEFQITDEEWTKAFESKDNFLAMQKKLIDSVQAKTQSKLTELENSNRFSRASEVIDEYASQSGNEDFYDLDKEYGFITYQLKVNPPKSENEWSSRLKEAHENARRVYQAIYDKGKQEALKIVQKKAQASSEPPSGGVKGDYSGPEPKNLSVEEAVALARKGIRVPRN